MSLAQHLLMALVSIRSNLNSLVYTHGVWVLIPTLLSSSMSCCALSAFSFVEALVDPQTRQLFFFSCFLTFVGTVSFTQNSFTCIVLFVNILFLRVCKLIFSTNLSSLPTKPSPAHHRATTPLPPITYTALPREFSCSV